MRVRPVLVLTAGVLAASSLVAGASASTTTTAVAGTEHYGCWFAEATLTGTGELVGTEGRDVIVATPPATVRALGGDDVICVEDDAGEGAVQAFAGSGDDRVTVLTYTAAPGDTFVGGRGRDYLNLGSLDGQLSLDLARGEVHTDESLSGPAEATATGFEDAWLLAARAVLLGTSGPNRLSLTGCDLKATGGRGSDRISRLADNYHELYTNDFFDNCPDGMRARFSGGRGRDRILGSLGDDRLTGGRGRDRIDGWSGKDRCRAEVTKRCER
ncbi:hypothetical protein [Nocardioides campestrisoli]|uniref:hypothetical protein n=1 Tax=Nocardioides campestrisoli TaxID=2736757 RepID=UPI0015E7302E|nr:hypothetical protein [Nocardioides campestrisoli]